MTEQPKPQDSTVVPPETQIVVIYAQHLAESGIQSIQTYHCPLDHLDLAHKEGFTPVYYDGEKDVNLDN